MIGDCDAELDDDDYDNHIRLWLWIFVIYYTINTDYGWLCQMMVLIMIFDIIKMVMDNDDGYNEGGQ